MVALSRNSLNKNTGSKDIYGVGWVAEWVRNYYAEQGYEGEALEAAVVNALGSMKDLSKTPAVFRVRVTAESFRISPNNVRYVKDADLKVVAEEIDERTRRSIRSAQLHPILVRPAESPGTWYVIAGVRRAAALLDSYAYIRIYIPGDAREEALLSLHENIIRKDFDDFDLITMAERSSDANIEEDLKQLLDQKTLQRLEVLRRPKQFEKPQHRLEDDYVRYVPKPPKPTLPNREIASNGSPQGQQAAKHHQAPTTTRDVERCPHCGAPLQPVCMRCGAPV